jgi:hypothetical protein
MVSFSGDDFLGDYSYNPSTSKSFMARTRRIKELTPYAFVFTHKAITGTLSPPFLIAFGNIKLRVSVS